MSEGKASTYRVVSAEELRRRALVAAQDRLDRANQTASELGVLLAAAETTYGSLAVSSPTSQSTTSDDPAVLEAMAIALESNVASSRRGVEEAVASARARRLGETARGLLHLMRPSEPLAELTSRTASEHSPTSRQIDDALRVIARLPGDVPTDIVAACERLVADISSAESSTRGDVLVTALRAEVQAARDRSEMVSGNREAIERLYRELDGLEGADVSTLRGDLRGLPLDTPLPEDLAARVARVREAAVREQDRRFALQVTRDVLEEQGYALGEDFVTVVATSDGAVLPLAASRGHGVRVRERAGQLLFNIVRFDKTSDESEDDAVATAFCDSFQTIVHRSGESGLSMTRVVHLEPGSGRVEVRDEPSPFVSTDAPQKRPQTRERRRDR